MVHSAPEGRCSLPRAVASTRADASADYKPSGLVLGHGQRVQRLSRRKQRLRELQRALPERDGQRRWLLMELPDEQLRLRRDLPERSPTRRADHRDGGRRNLYHKRLTCSRTDLLALCLTTCGSKGGPGGCLDRPRPSDPWAEQRPRIRTGASGRARTLALLPGGGSQISWLTPCLQRWWLRAA